MPRAALPRLLTALLLSVLTGLVLAAAAFPVVGSLGLTAKARADEFLVLPAVLQADEPKRRSEILAADGSRIALLYAENRVPVELEEIPELTRKAVIAIEDARFYQHDGVDYKGTLRAAAENIRAGGVSQGGSTLTQQYVKNALLQSASSKEGQQAAVEQSLDRKLKEARYALAIERELTKDEILERYLNIAYYGNGVYGMGTAANFYFGKPIKELTLAQGATLAGIVQLPGRFDPVKALKDEAVMNRLLGRRDLVLRRMSELGFITEAERTAAVAERPAPGRSLFRIKSVASGCEAPGVTAPYFCDYVRTILERGSMSAALGKTVEERQAKLLGGGLTIRTTLSPGMQSAAQRSVEEAVPPGDEEQIAAVTDIVEPGTGRVKAMVVNRRFTEKPLPGHTKVNLALGGSSGFQGGSTFKVFVLADAIRKGIPLSTTYDSPAVYTSDEFTNNTANGVEPYTVKNAGDSEAGVFDARSATHLSVNTYYMQLEERTGIPGPVALAESMGIRQFKGGTASAPLNEFPSFVLGAADISPLDLAAAYATFAARGLYCPPRPVAEILDSSGKQIPLPPQSCKQVMEPYVADTVSQVLTGVIRNGTGRAAAIGRPAAGKTGTTNGSRAAWFVGYTPQLATAVWVGDPGLPQGPGKPPLPIREMRGIRIAGNYYSNVYGGTIPAPIWSRTMSAVLEGQPEEGFERPARDADQGQQVTIPDVSGVPLDVAEQTLEDAGFSVVDGGRVRAAPVPEGAAAYTSPRAGRSRAFGSTVTLFESNGRTRR